VRNAQGGKIAEGNWLLWVLTDKVIEETGRCLMFRVVKITEPKIEGNPHPPTISLLFEISSEQWKNLPPGREPQLLNFFGVTNPAEEQAMERMLKN